MPGAGERFRPVAPFAEMKRAAPMGTPVACHHVPDIGGSEDEIRLLFDDDVVVLFRVEFYDKHDFQSPIVMI